MSRYDFRGDDECWHKDHRWKARRSSTRTSYKYCKTHRRVERTSSSCHAPREVRGSSAAVHTFKPFWHTELGPKPIYIESKSQYRREAEKVGGVCPL